MPASRYLIRPRPPVRALAIAAAATVSGAALLVLSVSQRWPVIVAVFAVLLLVGGAALAGAALWAMRRHVVALTLDEDGYHVAGAGQQHRGLWADVTRVAQNQAGDRLVIHQGQARTHLVFAGKDEQLIADVVDDIKARLRALHG